MSLATWLEKHPHWSPFSDEETVARGEVRYLAVAETALAIAVFWGVALNWHYFSLHWAGSYILFSGCFVAPLLLLRSDESVALASQWFQYGLFPRELPQEAEAREEAVAWHRRRWRWIGLSIGTMVNILAGYPAAKYFLVDRVGWDAFWHGAIFLCAMLVLAGAVAEALPAAVAGALGQEVLGALTLAATGEVLILLMVPFLLGILLIAVLFRVLATGRHALRGYASMPANIRRLVLFTAPFQVAELLPGLPVQHPFKFHKLIRFVRSEDASCRNWSKTFFLFLQVLSVVFWFLPAFLYRFILKSTLWLWWVLFFIGGAPDIKGGLPGARADAYMKFWSLAKLLAAFFVVLFFFGANVPVALVRNYFSSEPVLWFIAVAKSVKWGAYSISYWLTLISSLLTLVLLFWTQSLWKDSKIPGRETSVEHQLFWLGYVVNLKAGLGFAIIACIMAYIALLVNATYAVYPFTDAARPWLVTVYGDYASVLLPPDGGS